MSQPFLLPVVKDKTFFREVVILDGSRYEGCTFTECTIQYSGGPADLSACTISPKTKWDFQGAAALTLQTLNLAGWRFEYGTSGPDRYPQRTQ